ncbi:MAG: glycosyltransferase [Gammaproteobacteria bacterium]|nr:glycosyltransferase [Gammaproteobacteria bacterium]
MNDIKHQSLEPARQILVVVYLAVALWYFLWRLGTFNPEALAFSWVIYLAEAYGIVTVLLHLFMTWHLAERVAPAPGAGLTVDVFIPTLNEPLGMLRRTLLAALHMDYPHRTWVLDDGARPEVAALAEELGCRYLSRRSNQDAKAGNLNQALAHSEAAYVAVFDADHVPKREFLTRTLGYFQDPNVAFVQTPQDFYNLDSYQHRWRKPHRAVWTEQSLFFRVIQRGKDYWNAAFFCGSCAVLRRTALEEIGGFATGTVTEDLHTSLRLHKRGWKSVYHPESLAFGLAPTSVGPFLSQRVRWGQGAMQVWRKEGILFARGLTLPQRLNYLASVLTYFDGWQKGVFYLAPVIVLSTGLMPISTLNEVFLLHFLPYYVLTFWVFEELGRGHGRTVMIEQYNMARFAAFCWATLGLFRNTVRFKVTRKTADGAARHGRYIVPQYLIILVNALAVPAGLVLYFSYHELPLAGLVANILWAGLNTALGLAVVAFTLYRPQRRTEYRFPIPLPVRITDANEQSLYGVVDDISPAGFRLYARLGQEPPIGAPLSGEIYLPSGALAFQASVSARTEQISEEHPYAKAFGCRFAWANAQERDRLELFLYGSDLQWQLQQLHEQAATPLQWLGLMKGRLALPDVRAEHWAPIVYQPAQGAASPSPAVGLISTGPQAAQGPQRLILLFTPVKTGAPLTLRVFTRTGHWTLNGWVYDEHRLESPVAPIYLHRFEVQGVPEPTPAPSALDMLASKAVWVVLGLTLLFAAVRYAHAEGLWLGGVQVGGQGSAYVYTGLLAPLPGSTLSQGFVQRYWIDGVRYRYSGAPGTIQATAPGAEVALGYTHATAQGYYGLYLGVGYRDTRLSPDDPSASVRGGQWSLDPQVQVEQALAPDWKVNGIASYAFGPQSYWLRGRLLRAAWGRHWFGPELIVEGNKDYHALQVGLVSLGWEPAPKLQLGVAAGVRIPQRPLSDTAYVGVELSRAF